MQRRKYDSFVVYLYNTGREGLLPKQFRDQIPYSTISGWRKADFGSYLGSEYRGMLEDVFRSAEMERNYLHLRATVNGMLRFWLTLREVLLPVIRKTGNDKTYQKKVLISIDRLKGGVGIERALKLLGINRSLYQQWVLESRFECLDSWTQLCTKRHPHQMEMKEIMAIKRLLSDPECDHWPITAIASDAMRKGSLVASLSSWYKYSRIFGHGRRVHRKELKRIGLVATHPNEYFHVDTTYFNLLNGREIYIAFVMDNYSKMILGYHVSTTLSFDLVRRAMKRAIPVMRKHKDFSGGNFKKGARLVSDGGSENRHYKLKEFLSKISGGKIKQIRALKDIRFSNSPVEAIHRTMKGRYLRRKKFMSVRELMNYLAWAVHDYNDLRPHYRHRPKTPSEVYYNKLLGFDVRKSADRTGLEPSIKYKYRALSQSISRDFRFF